MNIKQVSIGDRPRTTSVDTWVRRGEGVVSDTPSAADNYSARLTIDVTPQLRGRIKIAAFRQGLTVAQVLRTILEREFPAAEERP